MPEITAEKVGVEAVPLLLKYKEVAFRPRKTWDEYFSNLNELAIVLNDFLDKKLHLTKVPMHSNYRYLLLSDVYNLMNKYCDLSKLTMI